LENQLHRKEISEERFEKIVVDTTIQLLAERAEPTPYTIVINYIDPVLARNGFFFKLAERFRCDKSLEESH